MNTPDGPKYSIDALPGDPWEVRRTKEVARAILRAKNARNLTTDQLAKRCSSFLGEADAVKTSTLNGLFAGKRRSISTTELEMFSSVLSVSVLELLYPKNEMVESKPARPIQSSDALAYGVNAVFMLGDAWLYDNTRESMILDYVKYAFAVDGNTAKSIYAIRRFGKDFSQSQANLFQLKYSAANLVTTAKELRARGEIPPAIPATASWVFEWDNQMLSEMPAELVVSLEPLYRGLGISLGDYVLGGSDGEHQEEA